ncbi:long-chain fatty acid--CoA ligase [Streptomyces sp. RKND-216]|uniref:class I adenylate-forming enzyme family protein n=1 Tax=Streptomyces sp. RKND-216 TaxID=2562581 RepID=UPI00109D986D|nr:class I adenylate-forming enzyme family protein [Streptomyces sp. RKND-216]THA24086.1 long-chain fatty acid--CoA ligase [Streptomyces sp. RKND-216]
MTKRTTISYLTDQLHAHAALHPDRVALVIDGRPDLLYGAWDRRSEAVARGLQAAGVRRGDRVGIHFGGMDWADYAVAYLGALKAGAAVVHLSVRLPAAETERRVRQSRMVGIVHGRTLPPDDLSVRWTRSLDELSMADGPPVALAHSPHDDAEVVYSSGTTGMARGVVVSHENLATAGGPPSVMAHDEPTPMVASVKLGITASATTVSMVLNATPTTLVLAPPGDADRLGALIEEHAASTIMMTPHLAVQLVRDGVLERYDVSSVRTVATASAFLHPPLAQALLKAMPNASVIGAYSASQAKPAVTIGTFDPSRPMSVGRPAPGTHVLITDEQGEALPQGQVGRIWLRAEGAPARVRLDSGPEEQGTPPGGWCDTGDLGHLDEEGELHLFDRESDAVRTPRGIVSTLRVESALLAHDSVGDVAVVGTAEGAVVAAVVPAEGAPHDAGMTSALLAHARGALAFHEAPSQVLLVDELPRNDLGKVIKRSIRGWFSAS